MKQNFNHIQFSMDWNTPVKHTKFAALGNSWNQYSRPWWLAEMILGICNRGEAS